MASSPAPAHSSSRRRPILRRFFFLNLQTGCSSLLPDCGDKLPAAKLKYGSNGIQTGGDWHLRWDFWVLSLLFKIDFKGWFRSSSGEATTTSRYVEARRNKEFKEKFHSKVSVLSGRYFKLTDKENENKERKISDVGISPQFTLVLLSQHSNNLTSILFASLASFLNWVPTFWSFGVLIHLGQFLSWAS